MRNRFLIMWFAFFLLALPLIGCNSEKDIQFGKMEEQIKQLQLDNARLKKEVIKTDITQAGNDYTLKTLTGVFIIANNLIWWVIARRRTDENLQV